VESVKVYETDLDVKTCFGNEFFILFLLKNRIELFRIKDLIYLVSSKNISPMDIIREKFSFMSKFEFKIKKEFLIIRNRHPWFKLRKNYILINDYSFFNLSVKMSDDWYRTAGRYLCSGKL